MTRYTKGTKLLLVVTYEIPVTIEEDGVFNPSDLWDLANNALLQSGDLQALLADCKVVSETSPDETDEDRVSRETSFPTQAELVWDEMRGSKDRAMYPDLNPNQLQFIQDVIEAGKDDQLRTYSGRGMFGRYCPGVVVDHPSEVPTKVRYSQDSMGRSIILYMP